MKENRAKTGNNEYWRVLFIATQHTYFLQYWQTALMRKNKFAGTSQYQSTPVAENQKFMEINIREYV